MPDKIVNHFVLADGSVARYDYDGLVNVPFGDDVTFVSYKTRPGYINTAGAISDAGAETQEVYTNKLPCFPGDTVTYSFVWANDNREAKWAAFGFYDEDGRFISRSNALFSGTLVSYSGTLTIPEGAYYYAPSWRTYGDCMANFSYNGSVYDIRNRADKGLLLSDEWDTALSVDTESETYGVLRNGYRPLSNFIHVAGKFLVIEKDISYTSTLLAEAYFFDGDKNFISDSGFKQTSTIFEPPSGAVYARVLFDAANAPSSASGTPTPKTVRENTRIYTTKEVDFDAIVWAFGENVKGVNHRGYYTAPENTLPAYKLSKQVGFTYCETDVEYTSDGVAVLLHDGTINRTARNADGTEISGDIAINSITYEQALTYDFGIYKGSQYAGTKIPTFEQFIKLCKNLGLHPYIELKTGTEAQTQGLIDTVKACGMSGRVTWISFSSQLLTYVKNYDPAARLGFVVGNVTAATITTAQGLKTTENEVFIDSGSYTNTEAVLCMNADLPFEIWTVNSVSTLEALDPYVSGVTSDNLIASKVLYDANKD